MVSLVAAAVLGACGSGPIPDVRDRVTDAARDLPRCSGPQVGSFVVPGGQVCDAAFLDILGGDIHLSEAGLTARMKLRGPAPDDARGLSWQVGIKGKGADEFKWYGTLYGGPVSPKRTSVELQVPAEKLPDLGESVTWSLRTGRGFGGISGFSPHDKTDERRLSLAR